MTDITVVDKVTGNTLKAEEFQQLLNALKNKTLSIKTESVTIGSGVFTYANGRMLIKNQATDKAIDRTSDVKIITTTVEDTTVETTVFTGPVPLNSWIAKNIVKLEVYGKMSNKATAQNVTIRVKVGGITIATLVSAGGLITDKCWEIKGKAIIRSVGVTGEMAWGQKMSIDGEASGTDCGVNVIDTTGALDITVTVEWNNADIGNTFSCVGGFVEYKN